MDREKVAAAVVAAELELQAARQQHDGSLSAVERYRQARARARQVERWAQALLEENLKTQRAAL